MAAKGPLPRCQLPAVAHVSCPQARQGSRCPALGTGRASRAGRTWRQPSSRWPRGSSPRSTFPGAALPAPGTPSRRRPIWLPWKRGIGLIPRGGSGLPGPAGPPARPRSLCHPQGQRGSGHCVGRERAPPEPGHALSPRRLLLPTPGHRGVFPREINIDKENGTPSTSICRINERLFSCSYLIPWLTDIPMPYYYF